MNRFAVSGPNAESERKALLIAIAVSLAFISLVGAVHWSGSHNVHRPSHYYAPDPWDVTYSPPEELSAFTVPANFSGVDFYNHSYGSYYLKSGSVRNLTLKDGQARYSGDTLNWFGLKKVYYLDVTGDNEPEAIVRISHARCKGACDGGSDLFYIYSTTNGSLEKLWQYETGSYQNGCGLKSLLVVGSQLVVEEFGRCPETETTLNVESFQASILSQSIFDLERGRFIRRNIHLFAIKPQNLWNYEGEISFSNSGSRSPL